METNTSLAVKHSGRRWSSVSVVYLLMDALSQHNSSLSSVLDFRWLVSMSRRLAL